MKGLHREKRLDADCKEVAQIIVIVELFLKTFMREREREREKKKRERERERMCPFVVLMR